MSHAALPAAKPQTKPLTSCAFEVVLAPDRVRVAQIRHITKAFMRLWDVPDPLAEDVQLAVSELVTRKRTPSNVSMCASTRPCTSASASARRGATSVTPLFVVWNSFRPDTFPS